MMFALGINSSQWKSSKLY